MKKTEGTSSSWLYPFATSVRKKKTLSFLALILFAVIGGSESLLPRSKTWSKASGSIRKGTAVVPGGKSSLLTQDEDVRSRGICVPNARKGVSVGLRLDVDTVKSGRSHKQMPMPDAETERNTTAKGHGRDENDGGATIEVQVRQCGGCWTRRAARASTRWDGRRLDLHRTRQDWLACGVTTFSNEDVFFLGGDLGRVRLNDQVARWCRRRNHGMIAVRSR